MKQRQIVVGYDGAEPSTAALEYGMRQARQRGLSVLVAHVAFADIGSVGGSPVTEEGSHDALIASERRMIAAAIVNAKREVGDVEVESTIVTGLPADALLRLAADAEMLVVGSRGLGTFTGLLVGSTSLQVAAHSPCPVVVVRTPAGDSSDAEVRRVVVGVDGSNGSAQAVEFAFDQASRTQRGLTAVSAWEVPALEAYGWLSTPTPLGMLAVYEEQASTLLAEALAGWTEKYPDVDVQRQCVRGHAVQALVQASGGAELLVVGSRGGGGFRQLVLGSVSQGVLEHGTLPVAVVPHGDRTAR